uniref:Izumo sperm-egg fusion protein 2 n=1 Tax=Panagrellus redivivus TaxID=6233 RepID=A0A7E4VQ51_PANRE
MNTLIPVNTTCLVGCEPGSVCGRPYGWQHPHLCVAPGLIDRSLAAPLVSDKFWLGLLIGIAIILFLFLLPVGIRMILRRCPGLKAQLVRLPFVEYDDPPISLQEVVIPRA